MHEEEKEQQEEREFDKTRFMSREEAEKDPTVDIGENDEPRRWEEDQEEPNTAE
jgi:hypothetical protein